MEITHDMIEPPLEELRFSFKGNVRTDFRIIPVGVFWSFQDPGEQPGVEPVPDETGRSLVFQRLL